MAVMTKKKPGRPKKDKVMKQTQLRLHPDMKAALTRMADERYRDASDIMREALGEYLGRFGYWPPKKE